MNPSASLLSRRQTLAALSALPAWGLAGAAWAQSDKPVRFILPVSAGSGVDGIARAASAQLAKALGVNENVLSRGNSISEFAENSEWDALQEELEATQNEVKTSMQSHSDQDLVILVSLGGWIRGTQVVSASII